MGKSSSDNERRFCRRPASGADQSAAAESIIKSARRPRVSGGRQTKFKSTPNTDSSLIHVLKSSCNFSLGCDESMVRPRAETNMIGQKRLQQSSQHGGAHLVSRSQLLLELRSATSPPTNITDALFYAPARLQQQLQQHHHHHRLADYGPLQSRDHFARLTRFNQTETANAMVGIVRIILVILICVLLFKLHTIPSLANLKSSSSNSSSSSSSSNNNNKSGQQRGARARRNRTSSSSKCSSSWLDGGVDSSMADQTDTHRATKKISQAEQTVQEDEFSLKSYKNQTNLERIINKFSILTTTSRLLNSRMLPQRRFSQPTLGAPLADGCNENQEDSTTNWQQQQKARSANERRRRFSDTNAIISSMRLPPGPTGLPFLGYLPFLGTEIHLTLTQLSQRFGPIYQIFLGGIRVVVLNDAALVRQAFKQTVFSGRPDTQLTRILQGYGIVNSDGALWKEQRAFLHSALRKLGAKSLMSGTNGLEAKIQNQVREFVNDLSSHAGEGKPCQVRPIVARAVSSVVGSVVMNLTYRKYEEKFDRLIELMQEGFRLFSIAMPLDFIPIFRFLPGVSYAYKKMKRNRAETSAFFQTVADEHRQYLSETFNLNLPNTASSLHPKVSQSMGASGAENKSNIPKTILTSATITRTIVKQQNNFINKASQQQQPPQPQNATDLENIVARDLVDAYLVQQTKHENDGKDNYFSDQQLVQIMSDIFSAGLETVTSTIEWSILFLILNPDCQEKIQCEIDKVVGRARLPQLEDLAQMPYTEATIYEVLRRSNVVALGNAHATLADATIGGYRIPKGTQVLPNLYGIHMNPKLWSEPEKFNPSRFIINDRAQKPDYFIPFSVGRRMCLGDVLAKMEVFLFLVGLLQSYDLSVHESDQECPPKVKGTIGVSNAPVPFRVALKTRAKSN